MHLRAALQHIFADHSQRKADGALTDLAVHAPTCWEMALSFTLPDGRYSIRNLRDGDLDLLLAFGEQLGVEAKELFCPYPWSNAQQLRESFLAAIRQSVTRTVASYLLLRDGMPIGHFFLWGAGGNAHAEQYGVKLPELGVAIADAYQRRGFGGLAVSILQAVARDLDADGIELTTATTNEAGWNTYLRAGFEYVGIMRIPLDVDVTAATAGEVTANRFRDERQMVYLIHPEQRDALLHYMAIKRGTTANAVI